MAGENLRKSVLTLRPGKDEIYEISRFNTRICRFTVAYNKKRNICYRNSLQFSFKPNILNFFFFFFFFLAKVGFEPN